MIKVGTKWIAFYLLGVLCMQSFAEDLPKLPNQGFMNNPPFELKKQFPMCDEFLDVHWISKEKGIGYVRHDLYKKDGKSMGQMKSLVYMQEHRPFDRLELYDFDRKGELNKLFEAIKNGHVSTFKETAMPNIKYGNYSAVLQINNGSYDYSYGDSRENICVPFGDGKRMWLVETKLLGKAYDERHISEAFGEVAKSIKSIKDSDLRVAGVVDINSDGIDDYLFGSEYFIFSSSGHFQYIQKQGCGFDHGEFCKFSTNESEKSCKVYDFNSWFVTTDGESYFLNNQCNLTELSK